jgi:hypothetical protein
VTQSELERRLRSTAVAYQRSAPQMGDLEARIFVRIAATSRELRREGTRPPAPGPATWPRRPAAVVAAALALFVLANLAAAYLAPSYGRALADAPLVGAVSGRLLQTLGLNEANATGLNDVSVSSGHTLRLVAGYADGLRTLLFVQVDGKGLTGDPKEYGQHPGDYGVSADGWTLTDQFGHSYQGSGVSSPTAMSFEPLSWPASRVGARLTLHIDTLIGYWSNALVELHGSWTLHATLVQEPVHKLQLPLPVRTTSATYTFTSVRATNTYMEVRWTVTGPAVEEAASATGQPSATAPGLPNATYFFPQVFDDQGHLMQMQSWGTTFPKNRADSEWNGFIHGPGRYRIQLGDALTDSADQRWIVVP